MELASQIAHFINIFTAGIVAGGSTIVFMVNNPAIRAYNTNMSLLVHQTMFDLKKDSYMRVMGILCVLSAVVILALHHHFTPIVTVLYIVGLIMTLVFIVLVQRGAIPIHERIMTFDRESPPQEFPQLRDEFGRNHAIRTALAVVFLTLFAIAGVASR